MIKILVKRNKRTPKKGKLPIIIADIVYIARSSVKLELAKYYKDFEMTAYISERSRNSKYLKKYDSLYFSF